MSYDNNNSGAIFKAKEKKNDKSPDYTGKVIVNGQQYRVSGWINTSKEGSKYMSLKFSVPESNRPRSQDSGEECPF